MTQPPVRHGETGANFTIEEWINQRSWCSFVPYRARTSILPVSGAEQLKTSGAKVDRPHDLAQRRVLEIGETRAEFAFRKKQITSKGRRL